MCKIAAFMCALCKKHCLSCRSVYAEFFHCCIKWFTDFRQVGFVCTVKYTSQLFFSNHVSSPLNDVWIKFSLDHCAYVLTFWYNRTVLQCGFCACIIYETGQYSICRSPAGSIIYLMQSPCILVV